MAPKIAGGDEVLLRLDVTRADNETFTVRFRSNGIRVTLQMDSVELVEVIKQGKPTGRKTLFASARSATGCSRRTRPT